MGYRREDLMIVISVSIDGMRKSLSRKDQVFKAWEKPTPLQKLPTNKESI